MSDRMTEERIAEIRQDVQPGGLTYAGPKWKEDIRELLAELDAVRGELAMALESYRRDEAENESLHASLDAVTRERDEARKDSARIDWLAKHIVDPWPIAHSAWDNDPRAAIDAAMANGAVTP